MASLRRRYLGEIARRVAPFLAVFGVVYVASSLLFYAVETPRVPLFTSFYWAIVTISTAGYGDVVPTNTTARLVAMGTLFIQIFLLGYLISVITTTVTSEQQKRVLGLLGTDLKGHIVVLGYGGVGRAAVRELLEQGQKVAVVAQNAEEVANIRALGPESTLYATYGPAGDRDLLVRSNVPAAHSVVVCTNDDATNMIAALNVRALAPSVRVVVSVSAPELRETLKAAGVTYVTSPADMGGRLCASAAFEPEVAHAIDDLSAGDVRSDMQEYVLVDRSPLTGRTFDEAAAVVRRETGCIVVGYAHRRPDGDYETRIDPPPDDRLAAGDAVVLLGTIANVERCRRWFGVEQGR